MKFYELDEDMGRRIPGRWTLGEVEDETGEEPLLECGRPLTGQKLTAKIVDGSEPLDFCQAILSGPVVRTSLAEAIAVVAGSDVQRIPLAIEGHYGFEILNTLRIVDCIDEAQSNVRAMYGAEYAKERPEYRKLGLPPTCGRYRYVGGTKIVLDAQRIPKDAHFFLLEGLETRIIVSERMKEAMEKTDCLGARFTLMGERSDDGTSSEPGKQAATPTSSKPKKRVVEQSVCEGQGEGSLATSDDNAGDTMKFYNLVPDGDPDQLVIGKIRDENGKTILLDSCIWCPAKRLIAETAEDGEVVLDYTTNTYNVPIARTELAAAIERIAGADLQRLPIEIEGHSGLEALNAVRAIECLDEEESDIRPMTERELAEQRRMGLKDIFMLVGPRNIWIDGTRVPEDAHFFRPKGLEWSVIVSERVKEAFEQAGVKSVYFMLVGRRAAGHHKT